MIKWRATVDGREIVGFGLSATNVKRLQDGQPIHLFGAEMGLPFDVLIHYGETEEAMTAELKHHGIIGPDTAIHDTRNRKKN